jgi:hypothetical protein
MNYRVALGMLCLAVFFSAFLILPASSEAKETKPIKLIAEFTGTLANSSDNGDLFGYSLGVNDKFFIVGSPGASPSGAQDAGAVYFFHKNVLGDWEELQTPFFIPFQDNFIALNQLVTREDWLFVPLSGTPENSSVKNNFGSILVFKKSHSTWNLVQTIQNPNPATGNKFGSYLNYSGEDWLIVGASDSSFVYFYKVNDETNEWELAQTLNVPGPGSIFVSIGRHHALISSGESTFPTTTNGQVYAYHLKDGVWSYKQTLEGNSPLSVTYNSGDSFGAYTAIYHNWAVIGAPTDNVLADLAGAAYFYHYDEKKKEWIQKQKVYSDWPSVFFGSTVSIEHDLTIIADPGKTIIDAEGDRHNFQGAANVYKRHPVCWDVGTKIWSWVETLIDPDGRAYDFLGGTGNDIHDHFVGLGTSTNLDSKFPDGFPGKRTMPYSPAPNNGRALLYKIRN